MNSFEIIYDFASSDGFKRFQILLVPIGIFLCARFFLFLIENDKDEDLFKNPEHQLLKVNIAQYASIFIFILFLILFGSKYYKTYKLYNNYLFETEGFVSNFHPMPSSGHDTERFTVNGVKFKFSDFDISNFGYNNAKSKGGAIDTNKYVRISYIKVNNSNQILKLEVRK
ncbi:hypothetical protein OD917_20705 [Flavobacterium sp. SH_e]|uniref:hypothetical protein n=1 Tax=Flavobacterium sp. SH_e TaxID=2983767 RepID=UPI0021E398CC|nr:hypothetical protein [Flavobacterium sp. SH_e]MCV2487367.1 hypothetical protein [Flavobacterium sp. SH_e]